MTHLTTVAAFEGLGVLDKIKHLPFQGSGPALQAMAAGTIQFFGDTEILLLYSLLGGIALAMPNPPRASIR